MAQARHLVMPVGARGTYHVLSRCTRRSFLLGGDRAHRREWAADLLGGLLEGFAIDLQGYAIMSNHVHLVLRPRPDRVADWDDAEIARRGLAHIPVRLGIGLETLPVNRETVERYAENSAWLDEHRIRLASITWLMKLFKQRLARRANADDGCTGHFWESRFQTVPLLDWGAVLACMAYVDRNPLRARMVEDPAEAAYASIAHRIAARSAMQGKQSKPIKKPKGVFTAGDCRLARHLIPLGACAPIDSWTGEVPSSSIRFDEYLHLVDPHQPLSNRFYQRLGIDPDRWKEACDKGGLFQGVAVGNTAARRAFATTQGKKIIADKTGIWDEERKCV